jgi:hypothetical protein
MVYSAACKRHSFNAANRTALAAVRQCPIANRLATHSQVIVVSAPIRAYFGCPFGVFKKAGKALGRAARSHWDFFSIRGQRLQVRVALFLVRDHLSFAAQEIV